MENGGDYTTRMEVKSSVARTFELTRLSNTLASLTTQRLSF
jgi:hypothetical protein